MKATIAQLNRVLICAPLQPELLPFAIVESYQAGETVMQEGDRLPAALFALVHETGHGLVSERAIVRLVRFIEAAAEEQSVDITQPPVSLDLQSHYHIARSIGITCEECVRLFKQLHAIVSYSRGGKITVHSWQELNKIAQGTVNL